MMLRKRVFLQNVGKRSRPAKGSRIRRGSNRKKLAFVEGVCGDEGRVLRKRKTGNSSVDSSKNRVRKKRKIMGEDGVCDVNVDVDRISELPEAIIHNIYAFLRCMKDVVRTSVLSKKWKSICSSYLVFDFDDRLFRSRGGKGKHNRIKARELRKKKFKSYVDQSLALRLDPVPCIYKFRLSLSNIRGGLESCMERWIQAAVAKNVAELTVHVKKGEHFLLPDIVLMCTSITSLKLSGVVFHNLTMMKLPNLRELSIKDNTQLDESVIKSFQDKCPLLEDLRIVCCTGSLRDLIISSLPKLRRVEVHDCPRLGSIQIASANLESFWFHSKRNQRCKIDLKGSMHLKNLTLRDCKMTDTALQDCISMCPLIEKLVLHECASLESLTILSGKLKSLDLIQCLKIHEVNIDAPNLYSFNYSGRGMPFSSMNVLGLREAKFSFAPIMKTSQCIVEYQKIFGNLDQSKGFKLIAYSKQNMKIYGEPEPNEALMARDYICKLGLTASTTALMARDYICKLELTASTTSVLKTVDNWLRECRGRSLVLVSPSSELSKLLHTMIMGREDHPSCCGFYSNKCWRHHIADVKNQTVNTMRRTFYNFKWRCRCSRR